MDGAPDAPKFASEHMALATGAILPTGWSLLAAEAPRPAAEAAILAAAGEAAKAAGTSTPVAEVRSLSGPGGKTATFVLLDADEKAATISASLATAAKKKGWALREMGAPSRLLVADAPPDARDALVSAQVKWAAEGLAARANAVREGHDPHGCLAVAMVALGLDPKNAHAHVAAVGPLWALPYLKDPRGPYDAAIAHSKAAVEPGTSYPLTPAEAWEVRHHIAVLFNFEGGHAKEARDILLECVKHRDIAGDRNYWTARYNLAGAHALMKEKDAAFADLTAALEQNVTEPVFGIEPWREAEDFAVLHDDPRWKALLEKYPPDAGK